MDGADDLAAIDALEVDGAPRGAMRKEMTDDNISSVPAGMPVLGRRGGLEKLGDHRGAGSRAEVKRP